MKWLLDFFRRSLDPSDRDPVPPGIYDDSLSVALSPRSLDEVVELFAASPAARGLDAALQRFFHDERAGLALRKAAHVIFDSRLRAMAAAAKRGGGASHLLDARAVNQLIRLMPGAVSVRVSGSIIWRAWAMLLGRSALMLGEALLVLFRWGRWSLPEPELHLAVMGVAPARQFLAPLRRAIAEAGLGDRGSILVVADGMQGWQPPADCPPLVEMGQLPVPLIDWLRAVVLPLSALALRVVAVGVRTPRDPWALQLCIEALRLARDSLPYVRLTYNHRPSAYIDAEEASAVHILRGMVLARRGGVVVRWPHSVVDDSGPVSSFLAYDLHLDSGPYQFTEYGRTWWPRSRKVIVGMLRHARELAGAEDVELSWRDAIEIHRGAGGKVAACFLLSRIKGYEHLAIDPVRIMGAILAERRDWLLVVKPKGLKSYQWCQDVLERDDTLSQLRAEGRFLLIRYEREGAEPCGSGYLIDQMDLGCGLGSVQIEALVRGKPVFGYFPAFADTVLHRKLVEAGLRTGHQADFEAAVSRWLDRSGTPIDYDWFRSQLDPFGDDAALARVARVLCTGDPGCATQLS